MKFEFDKNKSQANKRKHGIDFMQAQLGIIRSGLFLFENQEMMKKRYITAEEFDKKFDAGEDLSEYLQIDQAKRPALEQKKISLNLPQWMISGIDKEARKMGVSRQAILKTWIAEKLKD